MAKKQDKKAAGKTAAVSEAPKTAAVSEAPKTATPKTTKSAEAERALSNLALGRQLLSQKADEQTIIAAFTKSFKARGKTDPEFIKKRAGIYMHIAKKSAV